MKALLILVSLSITIFLIYLWRITISRIKQHQKLENKNFASQDQFDEELKQKHSNARAEIERLNLDQLKEAIRQTELKIQDENEKKERIDSRAYQIISISIWIITYAYSNFFNKRLENTESIMFLGMTGAFFTFVLFIILFRVLSPKKYSGLGVEPSIWFEREGSKSKDLHTMLVEILMRYENSVPKSQQSNTERLKILNFTLTLSAFYFILLSAFSLYLIWEKLNYI